MFTTHTVSVTFGYQAAEQFDRPASDHWRREHPNGVRVTSVDVYLGGEKPSVVARGFHLTRKGEVSQASAAWHHADLSEDQEAEYVAKAREVLRGEGWTAVDDVAVVDSPPEVVCPVHEPDDDACGETELCPADRQARTADADAGRAAVSAATGYCPKCEARRPPTDPDDPSCVTCGTALEY